VNAAITASANAIASSDENDVSTRNDRRNVRRNGRIIDGTPLAYVGLGSLEVP
jgi:hypothetical protein